MVLTQQKFKSNIIQINNKSLINCQYLLQFNSPHATFSLDMLHPPWKILMRHQLLQFALAKEHPDKIWLNCFIIYVNVIVNTTANLLIIRRFYLSQEGCTWLTQSSLFEILQMNSKCIFFYWKQNIYLILPNESIQSFSMLWSVWIIHLSNLFSAFSL